MHRARYVARITDDGERMVPEFHRQALVYSEHMVRYVFASRFVEDKTVLDVASGVGYGSDMLRSAGAAGVVGLDRSMEAVAYGRDRHSATQPDYVVGDAQCLPFGDQQFDAVVSFETIEHLDDHRRFLDEIKRVMRPDGLLIVSTPNRGVYPEGNPFHTKEFTFEEFETDLAGYFQHVALVAQDNWITSAILTPATMSEADQALNGDLEIYKVAGKPASRAQYVIALCSDGHLPDTGQNIALTDLCEVQEYVDESVRRGEEIARLSGTVAERDAAIASKDARITDLETALEERFAQLQVSERSLHETDLELEAIRTSTGYRLLKLYRAATRRIFPPASPLGAFHRALIRPLRALLDAALIRRRRRNSDDG